MPGCLTDGPEQWQVFSDEPTGVGTFAEYRELFQIEEAFLDDSGGLFGLEASCLGRMVPVISTTTLLLVSEGMQVVERGLRRMVDPHWPHWQRGLSCLKMGLQAVYYPLGMGQAVFTCLRLYGGADPEPVDCRKLKQTDPGMAFEVGWTLIFPALIKSVRPSAPGHQSIWRACVGCWHHRTGQRPDYLSVRGRPQPARFRRGQTDSVLGAAREPCHVAGCCLVTGGLRFSPPVFVVLRSTEPTTTCPNLAQ